LKQLEDFRIQRASQIEGKQFLGGELSVLVHVQFIEQFTNLLNGVVLDLVVVLVWLHSLNKLDFVKATFLSIDKEHLEHLDDSRFDMVIERLSHFLA
jgi:hypothetical protein